MPGLNINEAGLQGGNQAGFGPNRRPDRSGVLGSVDRGQALEARGESLRARFAARVNNNNPEFQRIRAGANLAAQRDGSTNIAGGPRGFSRQLTQASRRGKAREGIKGRGENAIRNQQLKDRLSLARSSVNRRGQLLGASGDAARLKAGGDAAALRAKSTTDNAFSGALGSLAGGAVRGFGDGFFNTGKLQEGMEAQQLEIDNTLGQNEFGVDNTFGGGFDFPPIGVGA
jgi:hypothetical protein